MTKTTSKVIQEEIVRTVIERHFPSHSIRSIKDTSKGCDNFVFIVELQSVASNENEDSAAGDDDDDLLTVVVRVPQKSGEQQETSNDDDEKEFTFESFPMHRPCKQAWVLNLIQKYVPDLSVPRLLALDLANDSYMIESYIPGRDMADWELSSSQQQGIILELGSVMKKLHSIPLSKFGYMSEVEGVAQFDNWYQMFSDDYVSNVQQCADSGFISKETEGQLNQIFTDMRAYLESYDTPGFVHADLCSNNIRLKLDEQSGAVTISGIIDFADLISGDGLYDIGRFLSHMGGNWSMVTLLEQTYGTFEPQQLNAIRFYALYFCTWLFSMCKTEESITKYRTILDRLLQQ